jgi:hypothetical protein
MLNHSLLKGIQEQLADGGSSKSIQSTLLQQSESSAAWQQLMKPIKLTCATVGSKGASNMVSNDTYTAAVMHILTDSALLQLTAVHFVQQDYGL